MKESYYEADTLAANANSFLDKVKHFRQNKEWKIDLNKTALLVIDMQKYFADASSHAFIPSMAAIIPNIHYLQNHFLSHNLPVIQTQHKNTLGDAETMGRWWPNILEASDPGTEIVDELCDQRVKMVEKTQYDAFWKTGLELYLKNAGIAQVIITGVMTHLCCESTARSAFIRGFDVFFAIDASATYNRDFHLASLLNLAHGFALPILTREIIASFFTNDAKRN